MHTLAQMYKAFSLLRPQVATSTQTGTGVDLATYQDDAMAIVNLGAASGTSATCIVTIQGSPDNSAWTTLTTFATLTDTSDNQLAAGRVDLTNYRYARAVATIAGTSPSFAIDVVILARPEVANASVNSLTAS